MSIVMSESEQKNIDSQVEQMMDWAKQNKIQAEQLAHDSARLIACTTDRVDRLKNQGFFKRCWNRLSGKSGEMERANTSDIIQMQKMAFRYVNMLQEQQLLMAHSLLSLKNNLVSLAVKEEETRHLIGLLAERTFEQFKSLEKRTDQLEISTNLQGWLLGLEEREYDKKYPTPYMRIFQVINDFYAIKKDDWNYNDMMFMRTAIRKVGLNPAQTISLADFINALTDEIQDEQIGIERYGEAICAFAPPAITNYSDFVLENVSLPVAVSMHGLKNQYVNSWDTIGVLIDELNISYGDALKRIIVKHIENMNVDVNHQFVIGETAFEIMGAMRLVDNLIENEKDKEVIEEKNDKSSNNLVLKSYDSIMGYYVELNDIKSKIYDMKVKLNQGSGIFLNSRRYNDSEQDIKKARSILTRLKIINTELYKVIDIYLKTRSIDIPITPVEINNNPQIAILEKSHSGLFERDFKPALDFLNNKIDEIIKNISTLKKEISEN